MRFPAVEKEGESFSENFAPKVAGWGLKLFEDRLQTLQDRSFDDVYKYKMD